VFRRGNPTPLDCTQSVALVRVAIRELTWVLPTVAQQVARWQRRAAGIPVPELRADACVNLRSSRLNTEGAALFGVLPRRRHLGLITAVVAYQTALDYLDTLSERSAEDQYSNGVMLHSALVEALDPGGPISDHYRFHPWCDDAGYLRALVDAGRRGCAELASYELVQARSLASARRMTVQSHNHEPCPTRRDAALKAWATRAFPGRDECSWFEWTAASCSSLSTFALLALAADPDLHEDDVAEAEAVYFPWICAASTLLDAFVDQAADRAEGNHSYVEHYDSRAEMVDRLCEIVHRSAYGARRLRNGERHALIATGMVSMYLSKASARSSELRADARRIACAAGSLPCVQLPIMRTMRAVQRLGDA
jgi:tetraprenyl-beta-curcumene synthase